MTTTDAAVIRTEDVLPVRSRIAFAPIIAGAVVAIAVYFLLTLLGGAIGMTISGRVRGENIAIGAGIWAVVSTGLALFLGGWVASQFSVGETKGESVLYGVIVWGVVFAMLMWLLASGVSAGFNAMVGVAGVAGPTAAAAVPNDPNWEDAARRAGVPQERIDDFRKQAQATPADVRAKLNDPANREAVASATTQATWWAFAGTLVSMLAAIGGAVVGSGPAFRLLAMPVRQTYGATTRPVTVG